MAWAGGFGKGRSFREALERAAFQAREALREEPDLLLFFSTGPFSWKGPLFPPPRPSPGRGGPLLAGARAHQVWKPRTGWTRAPAVSLLAASFPFPRVQALRFRPGVLPSPDLEPRAWRRALGFQDPLPSALLLFAGPKASHMAPLLPGLQSALPGTSIAGGVLGSTGEEKGKGSVFLEGPLPPGEAMGLALDPPLSMEVISLPGFRPLGPPHLVTSIEGEDLKELDGRPAWQILQGESRGCRPGREDPLLAEVSSRPPSPEGALLCGEARLVLRAGRRVRIMTPGGVRKGQWVRFCLPDPGTAREKARSLTFSPPPRRQGGCALLFACPAPSRPLSDDPAWALAENLGDTPFLGARSWAQIAAPRGCGPLLLGQTLVLCLFREESGDGPPGPGWYQGGP